MNVTKRAEEALDALIYGIMHPDETIQRAKKVPDPILRGTSQTTFRCDSADWIAPEDRVPPE